MANDNAPNGQPGQAPQHLSSQTVPAGNHAAPNAQPLDKQILEIARREKELRKQQEALKGAVPIEALRERAKADRNSVLKELGLDDLVKVDENDPVAAIKKQLEDMQRSQAERDRLEQEEKMYKSFRDEFSQKSDEFELSAKLGRDRDVFEAMLSNRDEDGNLPDWTQLAKQLEDNILAQVAQLKGSKKLAALLQDEKPATPQRHPLDTSTTLTSSDRTATQSTQESSPALGRQQQLDQLAKLIKFNT